jgi:hypothetical protein
MRTNSSRSSSFRSAATSFDGRTDRRHRTRLRELCDEVLASFRMARQADPFTMEDRAEGKALLTMVVNRSR